jgi:hypothetical protein
MGSFVSLLPHAPEENPAQAFQAGQQNAMKLSDLAADQALRQQQTQTAALQNVTTQRDLQDQDIVRRAYNEAGGDLDKTQQLAMQYNASPKAVMGVQAAKLKIAQEYATLNDTQLANHTKVTQALAGDAAGLQKKTDPELLTAWPSYVANWEQAGLVPKGSLPAAFPGRDFLQDLVNHGTTGQQAYEREMKNREDARAQQTANQQAAMAPLNLQEAQNKAATSGLDLAARTAAAPQNQADWDAWRAQQPADVQKMIPAVFSPAAADMVTKLGLNPEQRTQAAQAAANAAETKRHNSVDELNARGKLGVEQQGLVLKRMEVDPFGMLGGSGTVTGTPQTGKLAPDSHGDAVLQALPQPLGDQVKALAEGRMQFPQGFALKSPYWQHMISLVSQYDPSFDAVNYNARAKTRAAFTSGKAADAVNGLNTVIGHLDSLSQQADKMGNTSLPLFNSVKNWAESNSGDPRVKEFEANKKAVVDELTRVWRGSGGSEGDIKSWADTLNASQSPAQMHGVIAKMGELLGSKVDSLAKQYNDGMGTTKEGLDLLTPRAAQTLGKLQGKAAAVSQTPARARGSLPQVGDIVTNRRTGQPVRITAIHPDGTFDYDPVKQ